MGRVVSYDDLNVTINEVAGLAEIRVRVLPDGGPPFEAVVITAVARGREHRYAPGSDVHLLYDPNDLTQVHFDRSRGASCFSPGPGEITCSDD